MLFINLPLIVSTILVIYFNQVPALNVERIIGGYDAPENDFRYQIAVIAKANATAKAVPICGGALINNLFGVSAAHCFVNKSGALLPKIFGIIAGSQSLKIDTGMQVNIEKLYLPGIEPTFDFYNIVVIKLAEKLDIENDLNLDHLVLPTPEAYMDSRLWVVSGYGFEYIQTRKNPLIAMKIRYNGFATYILKYAYVNVTTADQCRINYPRLNHAHLLCGVMLTEEDDQRWGICQGDGGSPVVLLDGSNMLMGIANKNLVDCDDTVKGALYTNVLPFVDFINNTINGNLTNDVITFDNLTNFVLPIAA